MADASKETKYATTSDAPANDANKGIIPDGTPRSVGTPDDPKSLAGADDRVHSPQISVEGGKCVIRHFDLLQSAIAVGQSDDVANMTSFAPGAIKTIVFTAKDHGGRINLAAALEAIAGQLRGT